MKTAIILILSASLAPAAVIASLDSGVTSTVTLTGSVYRYEYSVSSRPLDGKRKLSHVTIDLCGMVFDDFASEKYKAESTMFSFKWDDVNPNGDAFTFGFNSLHAPGISSAWVKAANNTRSFEVLAPACAVPEPATGWIGAIGICALFNRKRSNRN